ncbi:DUF1804 family protein [Lawsonia intracellularis]|uniref:Uncharacterized protein n=1 Tax=Lawsonia intracellularis (strain PHE/MN1-00) TaxID=363253 RepID=Q1MNU7_LAWIP|nr:DUF1804 family protein [Lawsonia intracellularis]AGC50701.1 hypothetical protein LAW_30033 [Lawsonia intracellularis N343]KAA0204134.1 DUF1804 domain-containing protein [Lawsonia intracellularis]MBZ3893257.1 DUF1804 family protein [Lawsonia intracellularis]RBN31903.1 DUF1804 family protein [Lawsonia intracellularis]RBN32709.1 DUF1804 family protein [Lawsonia intracellularis]
MSAYAPETKEAIRNEYITSRKTLAEVASSFNVALSTAARWKGEAKKLSDDWDILREHFFLVGSGMENITRQMFIEYVLQHKKILEEIQEDMDISTSTKVHMLAKLSSSLSKTVEASRHALPKTDRLATALDVMRKLVQFTQHRYPQHALYLLEILEPFGNILITEYGQ